MPGAAEYNVSRGDAEYAEKGKATFRLSASPRLRVLSCSIVLELRS